MTPAHQRTTAPAALATRSARDIWLRFGLLVVVAGAVTAVTLMFAVLHTFDIDPRPRFALIDQDGQSYTDAELSGHWSLVYFGFTRCPHVCPTQMAKITLVLMQLEEGGNKAAINPVFITVDPDNDDAATIKRYLEHFHTSFRGLTGEPGALEAAARSFGVLAGNRSDDGYAAHSSVIYVVDPRGRVADYLPFESTESTIIKRLSELMR